MKVLKKEFDNVQNREIKSESGFSLAMASQPFISKIFLGLVAN